MLPLISVVVPVWNRKNLIERCLDSILNQTVKPYELIVVDNGSTDSTYEVVEEWMNRNSSSEITFKLLRETKRGACAARQKGLENIEGNYVSFFDSDDAMLPDMIKEVSEILNPYPETDIVCWKCRIHHLDGTKRVLPFIPDNPIEGHLIHTLLRPQGYITRREFLINAGGWTKPVEVWNDLELGLRLLLQNPKIIGINKVLAEIYSQENSITGIDFTSKQGKWERTLEEMKRVNEEHKEDKKISRILNYRKIILAAHYYHEGNHKGADNLLVATLNEVNSREKVILNFAYNYTKRGWRGIWNIVRFMY